MIVKKPPKKNFSKSKGQQISDLLDYIKNPKEINPEEKIEYWGARGFVASTHNGQKLEMISLASESSHSKMPVTHWVLSWKENEQPSPEQIDQSVDIFLEEMQLKGHQVVYGLHKNTQNYHLHIAVNRMNESTMKVIQPHKGFDKEAAHRAIAKIEAIQGWASEPNARYTMLENGEIARCIRIRPQVKIKQQAQDFEHATGEKSALRIAQERGHSIIKNAKNWEELHKKLAEVGLQFKKKGSGAIIFVGEIAVKASSVDRAFSLKKLTARLGEFETSPISPSKIKDDFPPEPVSQVCINEWIEYQNEKKNLDKLIRQSKEIGIQFQPLKFKNKNYNLQRLNNKLRKKSEKNFNNYSLETKKYKKYKLKKYKKLPRFEDWLLQKGYIIQADAWRYRNTYGNDHMQIIPEVIDKNYKEMSSQAEKFLAYARAVGAERFRVTCIRMAEDGARKTFILDKENGESKGYNQSEMIENMNRILRIQARGENIYYTPLSTKKHHILIDDMTEESLKQLKKDGFTPAVIMESSPGNFQCIMTIAKLNKFYDRDIGNRLTEYLNRLYGDKKLCGCIHPHRAPGFENRKPKHRDIFGKFPEVKLLFAEHKECEKAFGLSKEISQKYADSFKKKNKLEEKISFLNLHHGNSVTAYFAHYSNIKQHINLEDLSRVDSMIALRMRATGHSREEIANTIKQCAPQIRQANERRDWEKYAQRTADYAFGIGGDRDLNRHQKYIDHWKHIENGESPRHRSDRKPRLK